MPADLFRFKEFELDLTAYELRRGGQCVRLERIPFGLLTLLVERSGQLVTREEIIERVWGKGVFHDTEHGINTAVRKIRLALKDDSDSPRFVVTVPGMGYRFVAPVERVTPGLGVGLAPDAENEKSAAAKPNSAQRRTGVLIPVAILLGVAAAAVFFHFRRVQALSGTDTIIIADFKNTTGDAVFDDTLKQALSVDLSQSPFLNIMSDEKISETLGMMGQSGEHRINEKTAVEICKRTQGAAVLAGSIAAVGNQYVFGLNAVTCQTGDLLAQEQLRVNSKEEVLKAVDRVAVHLRKRLGESLGTIERFDVPVEQATTPSLEALRAYSLGRRNLMRGDMPAAVAALQRAVKVDPRFAIAYAMLGTAYSNLGDDDLAAESAKQAYDLHAHVSERERLYIESHYHMFVTGSVEKGMQVFEVWSQVYPRDAVPHFNLAAGYGNIGQYEKALEEMRVSLPLEPDSALPYGTLAYFYLTLNRFAEAQATIEEARAKGLDSPVFHITSYILAFARDDSSAMEREIAWSSTNHQQENFFLAMQADTAAYFGKLHAARELSQRAASSALVAEQPETAVNYEAFSAARESLFGNFREAAAHARAVLRSSRNVNMIFLASLALTLADDDSPAQAAAKQLEAGHPEDTIVQYIYLPSIRAQISLNRGNIANAIQELKDAASYELGAEGGIALYPVYIRGKAYLAARRGAEAAAEFQKILDHPGVVLMGPIGALAHLQLGRAYAMQGETAKARASYNDFLTLWKDADPGIPILKQAKAEYAKFH